MNMKKTIAALIAVMLMVSCLSVTVFAAEDAEMVPVVVKVPEGWEVPHAWAWADDGTNAFAAWPGEEMEVLAEGWYYIYVPGFVQNIIVNANQGTDAAVQTARALERPRGAHERTWSCVDFAPRVRRRGARDGGCVQLKGGWRGGCPAQGHAEARRPAGRAALCRAGRRVRGVASDP